jgi:pimeloyl-ACP methyl ester carboxylesterase
MSKVTMLSSVQGYDSTAPVIALHCSGSSGRQWRHLSPALGHRFRVIAPDLVGCGARPHWSGERRFRLTDEAAPIVAAIDKTSDPVHLVGHSYGGGVALRVACERPARIASLSLYEPTAFHVLKTCGPDGWAALTAIRALAAAGRVDVGRGDPRAAAARFIDFWNGHGAWDGMSPEMQAELARYAPKAGLDFSASIDEQTPLAAYRRFRFPVLLILGEHAPEPTALIARKLAGVLRSCAAIAIAGAGHMGPFSQAERVNALIANQVADVHSADRTTAEGPASGLKMAA